MKKVDIIMDLQYGSTGKGLLAGVMAMRYNYDVVITSNMPNAGHTYVDREGVVYIHHVLGNGLVSPSIKNVCVGAGSVFSLEQLSKEITFAKQNGNDFRVMIHESAMVLKPRHKTFEEELFTGSSDNGSTKQGSAGAMIEKIMRDPSLATAEHGGPSMARDVALTDEWLASMVVSNSEWIDMLYDANRILVEGSQGYSLGASAGFWPQCTSRECTPARIASDCGIPLPMINKTWGTARLHPIRVAGPSGGGYDDQPEITWKELGITPERTTTTKRERRVFEFSKIQMTEALKACMVDHVFLNFVNYDPILGRDIETWINKKATALRFPVDNLMRPCVGAIGLGPTEGDVLWKI